MPRATRKTTRRENGSQNIPSTLKPPVKQQSPSVLRSPSEQSSATSSSENTLSSMPSFPSPSLTSQSLRMSYAIARGEQGVLTFEPYKSILLPHWRFRTVSIAKESSTTLKGAFDLYVRAGDFVGADMARKFIQMGMTRARRYANHKGGKKYNKSEREQERDGGERTVLPQSAGHEGMEEKAAASEVFKEVWRTCIEDTAYLRLKEQWKKEKMQWEKGGRKIKSEEDIDVKKEVDKKEEVAIKQEEDI